MREIEVEATLENTRYVIDYIDSQLNKIGCPVKAQRQIDIAIDELFSNIARYAYSPKTGKAKIAVEFTQDPSTVEVTFTDQGIPYNPLEKADPDVTLTAEERKIGGLGIYIVKKSMDAVVYKYENGKNILTIKKNI